MNAGAFGLALLMDETRNISNSEVTTWLSCRQQYAFAFGLGITPKETSTPLARGTLGHLAMQYYIEARIGGEDHDRAMIASDRAFDEAMRDDGDIAMILETKMLYTRYMAVHNGWPEWELLGTEQALELKVTDTITIPMRYDLLVRRLSDGKVLVGDFKFTYDFWQAKDHDLNPQMPKYIAIMAANGMEIHGGFLEEIRTRALGKEKTADHRNLWKRTHYFPSIAKKRSMLKQHVAASLEIMSYRAAPDDEKAALEIPVLSKHGACRYCNFSDLCASKLDGGEIEYAISTQYVQNTYGYNDTNTKDELL